MLCGLADASDCNTKLGTIDLLQQLWSCWCFRLQYEVKNDWSSPAAQETQKNFVVCRKAFHEGRSNINCYVVFQEEGSAVAALKELSVTCVPFFLFLPFDQETVVPRLLCFRKKKTMFLVQEWCNSGRLAHSRGPIDQCKTGTCRAWVYLVR